MDVVGSEIGQKMRSAIKAKLTELGCYVDDELPDYVMVMVANKRTRAQMEDDLQLFLGDNTESFVNWLHQVLKKLQEVTVTPLKTAAVDPEPPKEKSKEKKSKDKKEKSKKSDSSKKSKKKEKEKSRKKIEKKLHKSKKKSKHHDMIRPNIPPLLMNMEKDSEPSITDVFAGQILKNHGITIDNVSKGKVTKIIDVKPAVEEIEVKRPILPIIDPATIENPEGSDFNNAEPANVATVTPTVAAQDPVKEMNEIEAKIQGLKQKLAEQLDSMSDDEDFLNIRTEAEELMNDFADDVVQEISQPPPATPVVANNRSLSPIREIADSPTFDAPTELEAPKEIVKEPIEELPQIELKLPKRPVRERLGERREETKPQSKGSDKPESPERFTPEKEPEKPQKSARSRLGDPPEISRRRSSSSDDSESEPSFKKVTSKVSVKESLPSRACASVVRVRPRPRVSAPSLLLKAVADAHKSLLNIPPKAELESKPKRALVLPMRRTVDAKQIVIQVPQDKHDKVTTESPKEEYIPAPLTMKFNNTEYVPSRRNESRLDTRYESRHDARVTTRRDDSLVIETLNIHNTTVDKDKNTQFIVTMDGFNPNAFLAKKLLTEGILDEDEVKIGKKSEASSVLKIVSDQENTLKSNSEKQDSNTEEIVESIRSESPKDILDITTSHDIENFQSTSLLKKRLSDTSDDSETRVIIKMEEEVDKLEKKRKAVDKVKEDTPAKRRKASPIVFDINRHEKEISRLRETEIVKEKEKEKADKERKRTDSTSSENHVTIATNVNTHKYDALPSLSSAAIVADRKPRCRVFPHCRFGAACAFQHPPCKYSAGCSRRDCVYAHPNRPAPVVPSVASHVVPSSNYKTITPHSPTMCKFFPQCVNPTCHFYHPKPCRYGKACSNKPHCNFYHV